MTDARARGYGQAPLRCSELKHGEQELGSLGYAWSRSGSSSGQQKLRQASHLRAESGLTAEVESGGEERHKATGEEDKELNRGICRGDRLLGPTCPGPDGMPPSQLARTQVIKNSKDKLEFRPLLCHKE